MKGLKMIFGPKKIEDHKIDKTVKCGKCGTKMYLSEDIPAFTRDLLVGEGGRCKSCGKYFCSPCHKEIYTGKFQCCSGVATEGIQLLSYIDSRTVELYKKGKIPRYSKYK
jgi:hypothetical protein